MTAYCAPSTAVRAIMRLPFGRGFALRLWNRLARLAGVSQAKTFFGAKMECDPRDSIQATILHFGTWEPNISRLFEQVVQPGDVVFDLGANVGYYSLLLSKLVGKDGKVIAVEALPDLARQIQRHAEINSASNITVVNAAVSDHAGNVAIFRAPDTNLGMSTTLRDRGFTKSEMVPSLPLVDLPADLKRVSLIKCDIEGAEVPVLRHLLLHLNRFGERLCVEVEASTTDNPGWPELFDALVSAGFRAYEIPNRLVTLWDELLHNRAEKPIVPVTALPPGEPDILFSRTML